MIKKKLDKNFTLRSGRVNAENTRHLLALVDRYYKPRLEVLLFNYYCNGETLELALITREVDKNPIEQRLMDSYINATVLCKAAGKEYKHYAENATAKAFITELSSEVGITTSAIIQTIRGGVPQWQGI